jgi:glutamate synthase (NADPH/NADH) large chain/glutamate synthase (ferredoxin)
VIGALLGAEAFGFGTAALVAVGCAMARQCHLNTCPTGIATQRPDLRKKFKGTPEQVVTYFTLLAQDVRQILADLGYRSMDEIVGRVELLEQVDRPDAPRGRMLDLSPLLTPPAEPERPRRRTVPRNVRGGLISLDAEIEKDLESALELGRPFEGDYEIGNHHLTVGARIAGHIARRLGAAGLEAPVRLRFRGSAGQSFGAWAVPRLRLELEGEANDHVGKGLSGGEIVIRPFRNAAYVDGHRDHVLIGNTALYGATGGRLFVAGAAGDRFAVRNSGAVAVVEGAGDHCCEYMTGGLVVVLGDVGWNVGAGMSNGVAYVLDQDNLLASRCNFDMVDLIALDGEDERRLHALLREHRELTESVRAKRVLDGWSRFRPLFRKVQPRAPTAPVVEPVRPRRAVRAGNASQTVEVKP